MRIVHVSRQFHPSVGGLEAVIASLAREQLLNGHHVRIVTLDRVFGTRGPRLPAREMIDGVEVVRVPFVGSERYPIAPGVLRHVAGASVVHVHGVDFLFDFLALTRPLHRRPIVATTHGGFFHTAFAARLKKLWFASITRWSSRAYDAVLACSRADHDMFSRLSPPGLQLMENGVDTAKFRDMAAHGHPAMMYFGRLAPNKGLERLLRWFAEVRRLDGTWTLTIAGRGTEEMFGQVRDQADRLGIGSSVRLVPSPTEKELGELIGQASVYPCASHHEGFGLAAVEAAAAGLFPVLSRVPAFETTLAAVGTGMLVNFDDPAPEARRFLREWSDWSDDARGDMVARTVGRYDWARIAQQHEEVYGRLVDGRVHIGPLRVEALPYDLAVERVRAGLLNRSPMTVAFCNAHSVNTAHTDPAFTAAMRQSVVLNDGVGLDIAGRLLSGHRFPANLNGTDFTPRLLQEARLPLRIFLLGSKPGVAERAGEEIQRRFPQHRIVGIQHGFYAAEEDAAVTARIVAAQPDLILVGMGQPRQELWAAAHAGRIPGVIMCIGAFLDFTAGAVTRAPTWVRRLRAEWVYRLMLEPHRLAKRYLVGNPLFVARVIRQRLFGAPVVTPPLRSA